MAAVDRARLDHVGLNVRDLDGMTDWYVRAFGYREQVRLALEALDLRIVMLVDDEGRRFELLARSDGAPGLRAATPVQAAATWGFGHVAFVVPDLVATHARLIALGGSDVSAPSPSPEEGWWFAWVHDPEGNLVELIGQPPA
ncbi:VOC family protein [Geodermatophilus sabuli]|uniref:VOC family protein n=1 Tax=Geodermatophilus sabuli TaxID=1564158 RepID=A0A7K3VWN5_9ACTN|nr:VOC family protein [Geodermatophilus sabuli]NEK56780.1 VOC family protein [Geodermatophilus sabuli]